MTLLSQLTDDQFALLSCGGALLAAFAVMTLSYHVGTLVRRSVPEARGNRAPLISPRISADAAVRSEQIGRRAA
jgi:hypothetical protein